MISESQFFTSTTPLTLDSGEQLDTFTIAYETYGTLNEDKSNVIIICHALSGDAHAAFGRKDDPKKVGWWDGLIGPDKAIDTNTYFVIATNTIGSCLGSSGPTSINPKTQKPYALSFPVITIKDMVRAQHALITHLNIDRIKHVIGGSMGGMQAIEWAISYPKMVFSCVAIATTSKLSPQALAFGAVGRNAIISDPSWHKGNYSDHDTRPEKGLSIARMIGHITYLSEESMSQKFGRRLQKKDDYNYNFNAEFQVESYLQHQGDKFVNRFDANSYLYLSKAMSYFDLEKDYGSLENAFKVTLSKFLILSISSDWIYPASQSKEIAKTLMKFNRDVTYCEIDSPYGHDAFLIEIEKFSQVIKPYLEKTEL